MDIRSAVGLAGIVFLGVAPPAPAKQIERHFHQTYQVSPGDTLHLRHGDGEVEVTAWEKDVLDVEVRYRARVIRFGWGSDGDLDVEFRQDGRDIYVTERLDLRFNIGFMDADQYEYLYTVRAPAHLNLDLEGEDGSVRIRGWRGEVACRSEDGDVEVEDLAGPRARIETEDGDIRVASFTGELTAASADGRVTVEDCRNARLRLRTEDGQLRVRRCEGDIRIEGEDADVRLLEMRVQRLEVHTEDGEVWVELLKSEAPAVEISTGDGDVSVELEAGLSAAFVVDCDERRLHLDLPLAETPAKGERRTTGELFGGRGSIRIRVGDAHVSLSQPRQ